MKERLDEKDKIFLAGSKGMVGSSIKRALENLGYGKNDTIQNLLTPSRKELDLSDQKAVEKSLSDLTNAAKENSNLLAYSIEAIKNRATIGEVSKALEEVYGRHFATSLSVSGVYGKHFENDEDFMNVKDKVEGFEKFNGRRPRVLIVKMGQDGHDRGAKIVATSFADIGFDIDMGPLFQSPKDVAKDAVENDVHAIGVSTLAAGHKTLVPELMNSLKELDLSLIHI